MANRSDTMVLRHASQCNSMMGGAEGLNLTKSSNQTQRAVTSMLLVRRVNSSCAVAANLLPRSLRLLLRLFVVDGAESSLGRQRGMPTISLPVPNAISDLGQQRWPFSRWPL